MFYPHTGRIPEGYRKDTGRRQVTRQVSLGIHSESGRHVLVNAGNMSSKQAHCAVHVRVLVGGRVPVLPLAEADSGDPPHQSPPLLPQAIPSTGAAPRISCQNVLKHLHTGRIPEGYRKGTGRVPSPPLSGTRTIM